MLCPSSTCAPYGADLFGPTVCAALFLVLPLFFASRLAARLPVRCGAFARARARTITAPAAAAASRTSRTPSPNSSRSFSSSSFPSSETRLLVLPPPLNLPLGTAHHIDKRVVTAARRLAGQDHWIVDAALAQTMARGDVGPKKTNHLKLLLRAI